MRLLQVVTEVFRMLQPKRLPNLAGDRDIEWAFVAAHIPPGPGEALDFGPGASSLGLIAAERGFKVTAVDLMPVTRYYLHDAIDFVQGDILEMPLPENHFDLVINCSTVEHVGLAGRYGVTKSKADGDLEAMARLRKLMKPDGTMLLVIPVGLDAVFSPLTRVYGEKRLPLLLEGYSIEKEVYWTKDNRNLWMTAGKEEALKFQANAGSWNALRNIYALGCFVLRCLNRKE